MKYSNTARSALATAVLGLLALGLTSTSAVAATTTANITVTATVGASCTVGVTNLTFGTYTPATQAQASSSVTVTCSNGWAYQVGLNAGLTTGASVTTRQMGITQPAGGLNYSLLTGSYTGANWGNTTPTWVTGTGNGAAQVLTVYGVIPANQFVTAGSYTDTIIATVNY
ncbi:MAG: spore coat U domain-containing protein [Terracidiphilus sp.]